MSSPQSFNNWVSPKKLDLTCVDNGTIGMIGSMYFVGFAISSGIIPPLSDKIGRKSIFMVSLIL